MRSAHETSGVPNNAIRLRLYQTTDDQTEKYERGYKSVASTIEEQ